MDHRLADVRRPVGGPFDEVNRRVLQQTTALLGATIGFSPEDWAERVFPGGWTRAHVAAHLVADAVRIRQLATAIANGRPAPPLPAATAARDDLEAMTASGPLDLQIELDTSAGLAAQALHDLPPNLWTTEVELPGVLTIAGMLPLARLCEVVTHHLDLADGFTLAAIDDETAQWCLAWQAALLVGDQHFPAVRLVSSNGFDLAIGRGDAPLVVQGDARTLLGWLLGRGEGEHAPWEVRG